MKDHTRRAVAYISGRIQSKHESGAVYDFGASKFFSFSGEVSDTRISVYDHALSCHISGDMSSLYHYGNNRFISLNFEGDTFNGYDHDTSSHFSGTVSGNSISIYDFQLAEFFNYSI